MKYLTTVEFKDGTCYYAEENSNTIWEIEKSLNDKTTQFVLISYCVARKADIIRVTVETLEDQK